LEILIFGIKTNVRAEIQRLEKKFQSRLAVLLLSGLDKN